MLCKLIAFALLATGAPASPTAASASPTHRSGTCHQLNIPITVSSNTAIFNLSRVNDDITATAWAVHADTWSSPSGVADILKNTTTTGTYNIHAQLCFPNTGSNSKVLQIATHGLWYDSRYWDAELDLEQHSYVEASLRAGYSILTYDRLGTGQSDHPDAYSVVQAPLELEILKEITFMARNGSLYSLTKQSTAYGTPEKIVHVGHSFGSFLTSAFIAIYPDLSDGAIITGYIVNKYLGSIGDTSFEVVYAATAGYDRPSGYVVPQKTGIQTIFFGGNPATAFTTEQLDYGNAIKQPGPIGELSSAYAIVGLPGPEFKGPIQFMLAEFDFFVCAGDCKDTYSLTQLQETYPKAATIEVYIQPNTGHGLTLHNNATAGFQATFNFLDQNGLGPTE